MTYQKSICGSSGTLTTTMNFLVTFSQLLICAACVSCTLYEDAFSTSNIFGESSKIFRSAGGIKALRSGSLATNEYWSSFFFKDKSDTMCNEFYSANSYETNVCIPRDVVDTGSTEYFTFVPSLTGVTETLYSDQTCMTKIAGDATIIDYQKECQNNTLIYTTPSSALSFKVAHVEIR